MFQNSIEIGKPSKHIYVLQTHGVTVSPQMAYTKAFLGILFLNVDEG